MAPAFLFRARDSAGVTFPHDRLLPDFVFEKQHEGPAMVDAVSGDALSHQEVRQLVLNISSGLYQLGIRQRHVVMLLLPNLPHFPALFLGIVRAGAICTTVNPAYSSEELAKQAQDSGTRMVITTEELLSKTALMPGNPIVVSFGAQLPSGVHPMSSLLEADGTLAPSTEHLSPLDTCALPYSSGTTGVSKGVMLSHLNFIANMQQQMGGSNPRMSQGPGDTVLGILPMFHIYGLNTLALSALRAGSCIITFPRFDFELMLRTIERERVTVAPLVPPIILGLLKHPLVDKYNISSLRVIVSGAAPLDASTEQALQEKLPHCSVGQGYGMSESSPVISLSPGLNPSSPALRGVCGSAGTLLPLTEARIVDLDSGGDLGPGHRGEVWVRGPQVMQGYLNNPTATAATLTPDGWLKTGDIGYFDSDGNLFLVDRAKELIKYKGFQVPPAELEGILLSHPKVADAAVVPKLDREAGEVPVAFVVLKPGAHVAASDLVSFVAQKVAPYKRLHAVQFVDVIPKSASGKILRRELKARL